MYKVHPVFWSLRDTPSKRGLLPEPLAACVRLCRPVPVLDSRQVSKQREPIEGGWLKSSPKSEAETSCSSLAEGAGRAELPPSNVQAS